MMPKDLAVTQEAVPGMYSRKCLLQSVVHFPCTQYRTRANEGLTSDPTRTDNADREKGESHPARTRLYGPTGSQIRSVLGCTDRRLTVVLSQPGK